jgi:hypothetical protein
LAVAAAARPQLLVLDTPPSHPLDSLFFSNKYLAVVGSLSLSLSTLQAQLAQIYFSSASFAQ